MKIPSLRYIGTAVAVSMLFAGVVYPVLGTADSPSEETIVQDAYGISVNFGKHTGGFVPWVYNSTNAPAGWLDDDETANAFQAAIDEWAGVCGLNFVYGGVDDAADPDNSADGIVVFSWDATIAPAAGQAGPTSNNATINILSRWNFIDGRVKMNPNSFVFAGGTAAQEAQNELSFHAVAVHELGHLIGLGHSDRPDSIMFANPYNSVTHITADDIQACRAMYGYSNVYDPRELYTPPATNSTRSYSIDLTEFGVQNPPLADIDDGTEDNSVQIAVLFFNTTANPADAITQEIVDPHGYLARVGSQNSTGINGSGGWLSLATYQRIRELPGLWTWYLSDSEGLIGTLTIDVQVALPVVNEAPDATFTYTENPATRSASFTTNVTGDTEGDLATIIWHIPGAAPITNNLGASSGVDNRNGLLNNGLIDEIWVEVNDDDERYNPPGVGGTNDVPGLGFHRLFRYVSAETNQGPDLDGNNSSDVLWRNTVTGQNWLYSMQGNLPDTSAKINTVSDTNWSIVGTGDYNADGKSDILWRNSVTGQLWLYLMDGNSVSSSSAVTTISNLDWKVVGNGDYDGNGTCDILLRNDSTGQLWMYLMNGSTISSSSFVRNLSTTWNVVGSGDANADGNSDILIRNSVTGQNWVLLMNGATELGGSTAVSTVSNQDSNVVGNADHDGDGDADILWFNSVSGKLFMHLMNGTGLGSNVTIATVVVAGWQVVGVGDYNGDGNADVLWRNTVTGQNWVFLMNGSNVIASVPINTVNNANWQIVHRN